MIEAWTHSTGTLWLRDLLPETIPVARVLAFGYDSSPSSFCGSGCADTLYNHFFLLEARSSIIPKQIESVINNDIINFPLILRPSQDSPTLKDVLQGTHNLAISPSATHHDDSPLRKLLDYNSGAVLIRGTPLHSAEGFSQYIDALSGKGQHAWTPHEVISIHILQKPQAKNVYTVNK
jgi:hypothetical protein